VRRDAIGRGGYRRGIQRGSIHARSLPAVPAQWRVTPCSAGVTLRMDCRVRTSAGFTRW
jgi:hypothetical protein